MREAIVLGLVFLAACSGGDGVEDNRPTSCDPVTERVGTYLAHFETLSGTCGDFPDSLARVDNYADLLAGCVLLDPDRLSEGDCKLERHYSCPVDTGDGEYTAITTQQDAAGSVLSGTVTVNLTDASGGFVCTGTYRVTFTRQ